MTPSAHRDDRPGDNTGQARNRKPLPGVVAGAALRGARLSAGISEADLATMSGVTEETVRAWEQGSSPLASIPLPRLERLQIALTKAWANPRLVRDMYAAAWCDLVILGMTNHEDIACLLADPITQGDGFDEFLAWSFTGEVPARYRPYADPGPLVTDAALIERAIRALPGSFQ